MTRVSSKSLVISGVIAALLLISVDAQAIPAFARQTKLGCNTTLSDSQRGIPLKTDREL